MACWSVSFLVMAAPEDVTRAHSCLVVAKPPGCGNSELTPSNVSVHGLPETTSFANLEALAKAAEKAESYIGTVRDELVFSAHLGKKGEGQEEEEEDKSSRPAKRRRSNADGDAARVANARELIGKSAPNLPSEELDVAQRVLTRLAKELRGPCGEIVVQSTAILSKKLGLSDSRPRVVVAARLNAGVEISVSALKSCLGECWDDGLLTALPTLHGIGNVELPLSEEAAASTSFGNATILLVTSVPTK